MNSPASIAKLTSDKHGAVANVKRGMVERDDVHEFGPLNALSTASSSPSTQSWNEIFAGIVSVTAITGTLAAPAIARIRSVSFSETWLL